jgi:hypothetical protein
MNDVDLARAFIDERDGTVSEHIRGDIAALAMAFRRIRRSAEAAAYERALLCVFDAICEGCGRELDMDRLRERIRALATQGDER